MALLVGVFEATAGNAEFRRQIATPNVPRFAASLVVLAEKSSDEAVKVWLFPTPPQARQGWCIIINWG